MNRDTTRAILLAAALMTLQALMLAALATGGAHAATVYRCAQDSGATSYQAHPCAGGSGTLVRADDARSEDQQAHAQANHTRQMAWLARQEAEAGTGKRTPPSKPRAPRKPKARKDAPATKSVAVALSSHRIGQRPFERLGQQVTEPGGPQKQKRRKHELTARAPAKPRAETALRPSR